MARHAHALWTALLTLLGTLYALHRNVESDLYFHLSLGRAVLRHGRRVVPEPTAFDAFDPSCVVPVWLWDVAMYAVYALGGFEALGVATLLTAALSSFMVVTLATRCAARESCATVPLGPLALVASAAITCVAVRYQMRPQTFAALVLALFLWLVLGYAAAEGARRTRYGVAIALTALVWAQVHNSFVLAPVVLAIFLLPGLRTRSRAVLRGDALLLAACLGSLLSSAHGVEVIAYTLAHGGGDAVRHVDEMRKPTLAEIPDLTSHAGRAQCGLWLLALFGLVRSGVPSSAGFFARIRSAELFSALLGLVLYSRSIRFALEDALLTLPLAMPGALRVFELARAALAARTASALLGAASALFVLNLAHGVLARAAIPGHAFALGVDPNSIAPLASRYLERLPEGSNVLTTHAIGPYVGLLADGRVRTYVDGRTPMYFHDTDFAVHRDVLSDPAALPLALERWSVRAVVIERDRMACDVLAKLWTPVVIEARFTTFVPPGGDPAIAGVDPCGPAPLRAERCTDGGRALDAGIAQLARLGDAPMLSFLRAGRLLLCSGSAEGALRALERTGSMAGTPPHTRLRARALLETGRTAAALDAMHAAIARNDVSVLSLLALPAAARIARSDRRALIERALFTLDDAAEPGLRVQLAVLCAEDGDVECVRFQALRAAARGEQAALGPLFWLGQHHPSARVRADAHAWGQLLHARRP